MVDDDEIVCSKDADNFIQDLTGVMHLDATVTTDTTNIEHQVIRGSPVN